jgi:Bacterial aa3 type cytochrome c oxidase subunit IV
MAAEIDQQKQMQAHEGTYSFFIKLMKRGTIISLIVALIVIWLISR